MVKLSPFDPTGFAGERTLPVRVADDGDTRGARLVLAVGEDAPVTRPDAERRKVIRGDERALDVNRFAAAAEVKIGLRVPDDLLHQRTLIAVVD